MTRKIAFTTPSRRGKSLAVMTYPHWTAIAAALKERFGEGEIDFTRITFDVAPSGLFLGVSVDGERIFDNPAVAAMNRAAVDLTVYGTSALWINEAGGVELINPADLRAGNEGEGP